MAYEGWVRFGGNEVVNNERARGIASTVDCPMHWIKGPRCLTLQEALGDADYTAANLPDAPWFDSSMPELSGRFFGVYALSISGLNDSTRSASVVEGIDDGATIGRTRKSARSVRVRAILLARGRDALDYGVAWLNAALDPDACGQHGTGCGTTDLEYLTDCPPARGEVPDFTPWVESRWNLANNPRLVSNNTGWTPGVSTALTATADGMRAQANTSAAGAATVAISSGWPLAPGERRSLSLEVTNPIGALRPIRVFAGAFSLGGTTELIAASPEATIAPGETVTLVAPSDRVASAGTSTMTIAVSMVDRVEGDTLVARNFLLEAAATPGAYFDGSLPATDTEQYAWLGGADSSQSVEVTRSVIERPQTDAEYEATVDGYRRFLHNVSVTSGPLERELMNKGEFWGQIFEWTYTAGRPWVYSATRAVDLPITPTVVIQDTPFNLVPYPSAELAGGDVDAAYNFSANPSVETNATGWAAGSDGSAITNAMLTSGRVTGELAAVGTSSYRVVFTASGAGTNGSFYAQQEVNISGRPAGSRVSINFWAAELLMAGAPVRADIVMRAYWRATAGGAVLRTDNLGTIPVNGGALSAKSLVPPAGANFVLVRAEAFLTSWPAGTVLRLYADALAVTVP